MLAEWSYGLQWFITSTKTSKKFITKVSCDRTEWDVIGLSRFLSGKNHGAHVADAELKRKNCQTPTKYEYL